MLRWRRGGGGVMIVENGVKTEFVPNSELPKLACLDLYSCKTIIICNDVYIICKINKCCGYEIKKNKFQVWLFSWFPLLLRHPKPWSGLRGRLVRDLWFHLELDGIKQSLMY